MRERKVRRALKIGDGSRHTKNTGVRPGRQRQRIHGIAQKFMFRLSETAVLVEHAAGKIGIGPARGSHVAFALNFPRADDALAHLGRRRSLVRRTDVFVGHGRNLHVHVYAVQKRPGKSGPVTGHGLRGTGAFVARIGSVAARAGIHGRKQHEIRRIRNRIRGAGNEHPALLQRLTQNLEGLPLKFGKLVQKKHAPVREAHLSGMRRHPAPDDGHARIAVMRRAEGTTSYESAPVQHAGHAVDLGHFQRLFPVQRGKNARHATGKHGLAAARRSDEKKIVRPRRSHFHGALGLFLPLHVGKVGKGDAVVFERHGLHRGKFRLSGKKGRRFGKRTGRKHVEPFGHGGFFGVVRGHQQSLCAFRTGEQRKRKRARHGLEPAVERKLGGKEPALQTFRGQHSGGAQQTERKRKIVGRAFLSSVGRSQIHGDAPRRNAERGILQCLEHALPRLPHRTFGQSHHDERRHALPAVVDLKIDAEGIHPQNRPAGQLHYHADLRSSDQAVRG